MKRKDRQIKLLEDLIKTPSPSGFERQIAEFIKKELLEYLPKNKVKIDFQNNVIAIIKGKSNKSIMIDAHLDQIGFIVSNINRDGLISLKYIGGGDKSIISARHLTILTEKGNINAVVNRKHAHLVNDEEDETIEYISEAQVDIGLRNTYRNKKKVQNLVKIGDPVVYKPLFYPLQENNFCGYGFDDKSGCFILMETIREISKLHKKLPYTVIFTFSSQEETGLTKVKPLIRKYNPLLFIECDVTFATDYLAGEDLEREVGRCELGKGMVLYKGVDINKGTLKLLESTSRANKLKIQYQASTGSIGYVNEEATNYGLKAVITAIPLRNMHTSVETINLNDLRIGISLLTNFLFHRNLNKILES